MFHCHTAVHGTSCGSMTDEQLQQCKQDLKEFYSTHLCKIQTDPLDLNSLLAIDTFTTLSFVDDVLGKQTKTPIEIKNLLQTEVNGSCPKRLLLQGESGAGKTTICSKIAWEWVNGRHFTEFEMVLVIPLGTSEKRTVGEIAKSYMSDTNFVEPEQLNNFILSHPDKVFLLFDGFDELKAGLDDQCDVMEIITLKRFTACKVLITASPWKAGLIRRNSELRPAYAVIIIEGYSKANIQKFFAEDKSAGAELIHLMEYYGIISESVAPFPIFTALLCHVWKYFVSERTMAVPKLQTFSELFDKMTGFLIDRYISKGGDGSGRDRRCDVRSILEDIGEAALKGTLEGRKVLNAKYFNHANVVQTGCKLGVIFPKVNLLSRKERGGQWDTDELSVMFPHMLFQEYAAGLYLTKLYTSNREEYNGLMTRGIGPQNPPI